MNKIVGLAGLSLCSAAAGIYFIGWKGLCIGVFVAGFGLFIDSLQKNK